MQYCNVLKTLDDGDSELKSFWPRPKFL